MKPSWCYCFCLSHSHNQKLKRNHQIASSRAKTTLRQSQACVKYRCFIICIKRNTDVNIGDEKILHKKMSTWGWFSGCYLQFLLFYMVCLPPYGLYAWPESYDRHGSFVTKISGWLIVSPVLWALSSRNTLSVTHSDTDS